MLKKIQIEQDKMILKGHLTEALGSQAWVIFVHGSGSSHLSSRNNLVAKKLNEKGFSTLLFDLLSPEEDHQYENRFDIPLLSKRLLLALRWLQKRSEYRGEPVCFFGASTGAAAALRAAAELSADEGLFTVISRGGRPDLTGAEYLQNVHVPVLLIVGSKDYEVIEFNETAGQDLKASHLSLVPDATHLFEEPGALEEVVSITLDWLEDKLPKRQLENQFQSVSP